MVIHNNISVASKYKRIMQADVYYLQTHKKKPVIIFTHGYKSFKDWGTFDLIGQEFARKWFVFVKFNLSHNGTTPEVTDKITDPEAFGNNNIEIELSDMKEILSWVQNNTHIPLEEIDENEIYLLGHSRGGANSIIFAHENPVVKKIACWAGMSDYLEIWDQYYNLEEWGKNGVVYRDNPLTGTKLPLYYQMMENLLANQERFNIKKVLSQLQIPVMLIHGIEDDLVSYRHSIEMKKHCPDAILNLFPGASHTFGGFHPYTLPSLPVDSKNMVNDVIEFFTK